MSLTAEHWQSATDDLIKVELASGPCVDYGPAIRELESDIKDEINRQVTLGEDVNLIPFVKGYMEPLRNTRDVRATNVTSSLQNEVFMFNDLEGPNRFFIEQTVFGEIARDIGYECWVKDGFHFSIAAMCAPAGTVEIIDVHGNRRTEHYTDIIVRRSAFDKSDGIVPWGARTNDDPLLVPASNARFNMCNNSIDNVGGAYETMLHEGGHALGSSYGVGSGWVDNHHPQIAGSILNYDNVAVSKVPGVPPIRHDPENTDNSDFDQNYSEPDCAPYPLDLMAVYALYQTD